MQFSEHRLFALTAVWTRPPARLLVPKSKATVLSPVLFFEALQCSAPRSTRIRHAAPQRLHRLLAVVQELASRPRSVALQAFPEPAARSRDRAGLGTYRASLQ